MCKEWMDRCLTINHSPTSLPKQERMWAPNVKEMKSSSKINLKDVSWWMSITNTYKLRVLVTAKLSKERCIFLATRKRLSWATQRHNWKRCDSPSTWETYFSKMGLLIIWNMEHTYTTIITLFFRKVDGAQSSIDKMFIPLKEIRNRTWSLVRGLK